MSVSAPWPLPSQSGSCSIPLAYLNLVVDVCSYLHLPSDRVAPVPTHILFLILPTLIPSLLHSTLPFASDFHSFNCAVQLSYIHSLHILSFPLEIFHIHFSKPSACSRIHFVRLLVLECDSPSHQQQR